MQEKEPVWADTNAEVRRRRLLQLAEAVGGLDMIAVLAQASAQNLDHIVKRRRASGGKNKIVSVGDDLARRIEVAFGLDPGWMDWPFPAVPFHAWTTLSEQDRGFAQAGLMAAIRQRADVQPERLVRPTPEEVALFESSHARKVKPAQRRKRA